MSDLYFTTLFVEFAHAASFNIFKTLLVFNNNSYINMSKSKFKKGVVKYQGSFKNIECDFLRIKFICCLLWVHPFLLYLPIAAIVTSSFAVAQESKRQWLKVCRATMRRRVMPCLMSVIIFHCCWFFVSFQSASSRLFNNLQSALLIL